MAADRPRPQAGGALPVLPPVFALVELAIFAAVVFAEFAWPSFPNLNQFNPHPYWLPVLLISLQYGTLSGLLTAAVAILGALLVGLPEQDIGEPYFNYLIRAWAQPVLWLVVALLLGAFRTRQIGQQDELLHQVEELEQQGRLLDAHAGALQVRCERLERELVNNAQPVTEKLLDSLARLATVGPDTRTLAREVEAALDAAFPDCEASIFVRVGNGLQLVHAHRWPDAGSWPRVVSGLDALALSIGVNRSLSILSAGDEKALTGHGLFAVPIFNEAGASETGAIGMLKIERLASSAITDNVLNRLTVLAAHLPRVVSALEPGLSIAATSSAQIFSIPRVVRRPSALSGEPKSGDPVLARAAANDSAG
jgi:polysaccharide biosynthesis protein PelD